MHAVTKELSSVGQLAGGMFLHCETKLSNYTQIYIPASLFIRLDLHNLELTIKPRQFLHAGYQDNEHPEGGSKVSDKIMTFK